VNASTKVKLCESSAGVLLWSVNCIEEVYVETNLAEVAC